MDGPISVVSRRPRRFTKAPCIPQATQVRRFELFVTIFLSYCHRDAGTAEALAIAIRAGGNSVFFDRDSLPKGAEYDARIREQIHNADLFIFLLSPESVAPGTYA